MADKLDSHIQRLEAVALRRNQEFIPVRALYNPGTFHECQVFELITQPNQESEYLDDHEHLQSDELFYVITGSMVFNDGSTLNAGESRLIKAGFKHGGTLSAGGKAIIIVRPPTPEYEHMRTKIGKSSDERVQ